MTIPHASFAALAELAPIGSTTRTWEACRLVYVEGKSQTEAAAATGLHIATVSNAVAKCEATYYRLPALLATVRSAMGEPVPAPEPQVVKKEKPRNSTPRRVLAAEARARGDKTFIDPNPCVRGHDAPFYSSGGACTKCVEENNARTLETKAKFLERLARSEV